MSMLINCEIAQCRKFTGIKDDDAPTEIGADKDLLIGKNARVTLTIANGKKILVRDIVVLGSLEIRSSDFDNPFAKGSLVARDIFIPGKLSLIYVNVEVRKIYQPRNVTEFNQELREIVKNWLALQKELDDKVN